MKTTYATLVIALLLAVGTHTPIAAQSPQAVKPGRPEDIRAEIDRRAAEIEAKLVATRRHLHEHPELSNREVETGKYVAEYLRSLGLEVQTAIAFNGVVAVLKGGQAGPVIALRADMDGLPVTEVTGLPFASKAIGEYNGQKVGVMHACGHDAHTAILLAAAEILTAMRAQVPGTVKFIFQPCEESAPEGEEGGAYLMIKQGVLQNPAPEAIFGLHVEAYSHVGTLSVRPGPTMAAVDKLKIIVRGKQTHGARPWQGVDPIVVASHIVTNLQSIVSRQIELTLEPAVVTVAVFQGGVRNNIIPDTVRLEGTIRTYDARMRLDIHARIQRIAQNVAEAHGATAEVHIIPGYPVTFNDSTLTERMMPTLRRVAGPKPVKQALKSTGAEDFAYFQQQIPGVFFFVGATSPNIPLDQAPANHSPRFLLDEGCLPLGLRAIVNCVFDYAETKGKSAKR